MKTFDVFPVENSATGDPDGWMAFGHVPKGEFFNAVREMCQGNDTLEDLEGLTPDDVLHERRRPVKSCLSGDDEPAYKEDPHGLPMTYLKVAE